MLGTPPHLPSITAVSLGPLVVVIMVCLLLEVFAGFVTWRASRITQAEADMTVQRQTLKRGVAKVGICRWSNDLLASQTNYTSTFVENSKLKRLLLKVEKEMEKLQAGREIRQKAAAKAIRAVRVFVYGSLVVLMWGVPLVSFSPDYLWPSTFSHSLSGGRAAGSVGAMSIVAMFVFGLAPRFCPG